MPFIESTIRRALAMACIATVTAVAVPGRASAAPDIPCLVDDPTFTAQDWVRTGSAFTALPTVPGAALTEHLGLNDQGDFAGAYLDDAGLLHGFVRDRAGQITTLDAPKATETGAIKVNDRRQVVGVYEIGDGTCFGFLWEAGTFTPLEYPGAVATLPGGINDRGVISGSYLDTLGAFHGFVRSSSGVYSPVDFPGATLTQGTAIGNGGQLLGLYQGGGTHAFLRDERGAFATIDVKGAAVTAPLGINGSVQIVGYFAGTDGVAHGYLREGAAVTTIDAPREVDSTQANDINDAGQILVGGYVEGA
jgi:hypothetical protein